MTVEEFRSGISLLDKTTVAKETAWWIEDNVKNFIDTKQHSYSLCFLAHEEKMPEMAKLEALCRQIDDVDIEINGDVDQLSYELENNQDVSDSAEMQEMAIDFLEEVRGILCDDQELTAGVMKAFAYYYDFVGYTESGEDITRPLTGFVEFTYLSYENADMSVTITAKIPVLDSLGRLKDYKLDKENAKTTKVPASFCIDLVVQLWEDKGELSLF